MCDPFINRVHDPISAQEVFIKLASLCVIVFVLFSFSVYGDSDESSSPIYSSEPNAQTTPHRPLVDMCLICVEFEKERLTVFEARRNLGEMTDLDDRHVREVKAMLEEAEQEEESEDGKPPKGAYD